MKVIDVRNLALPGISVIRFERFRDFRGYLTEHLRYSDLFSNPLTEFMKPVRFSQAIESSSKPRTIRGLHFQWNPPMGKLVRTISGHMLDLVADIRKGSPYFGKIIGYEMRPNRERDFDEWIWVPPGFAHGNVFFEETTIEYLCTADYNPDNEAGISPLAGDLDWSLCDALLHEAVAHVIASEPLMTIKDKTAPSVSVWSEDLRSECFKYGDLPQEWSIYTL
jgi:dTDP-4-dehydrorhamnose 3,5-epimerase